MTKRKFLGWEELEKVSQSYFEKNDEDNTPDAAIEVIYNTKTDKIYFFERVSINEYAELDENEIRLGYVTIYLDEDYSAREWLEEKFQFWEENHLRD